MHAERDKMVEPPAQWGWSRTPAWTCEHCGTGHWNNSKTTRRNTWCGKARWPGWANETRKN
eukprot:3449572-Alexandrium_andersonii.AAC.1